MTFPHDLPGIVSLHSACIAKDCVTSSLSHGAYEALYMLGDDGELELLEEALDDEELELELLGDDDDEELELLEEALDDEELELELLGDDDDEELELLEEALDDELELELLEE